MQRECEESLAICTTDILSAESCEGLRVREGKVHIALRKKDQQFVTLDRVLNLSIKSVNCSCLVSSMKGRKEV